jgi:hypothetical protein
MEAKFLTPLLYEPLSRSRWILTDSLVFRSEKYRGKLIAPRGFQTDFASIPRIVQWLFPKRGPWDLAAVIHDAAYSNALMTENGERIFCIKRVADDLFSEGMKAEDVSGWRVRSMTRTVRIFGDPLGHPLRFAASPPQVALAEHGLDSSATSFV